MNGSVPNLISFRVANGREIVDISRFPTVQKMFSRAEVPRAKSVTIPWGNINDGCGGTFLGSKVQSPKEFFGNLT